MAHGGRRRTKAAIQGSKHQIKTMATKIDDCKSGGYKTIN
jgi:hypothetical protein